MTNRRTAMRRWRCVVATQHLDVEPAESVADWLRTGERPDEAAAEAQRQADASQREADRAWLDFAASEGMVARHARRAWRATAIAWWARAISIAAAGESPRAALAVVRTACSCVGEWQFSRAQWPAHDAQIFNRAVALAEAGDEPPLEEWERVAMASIDTIADALETHGLAALRLDEVIDSRSDLVRLVAQEVTPGLVEMINERLSGSDYEEANLLARYGVDEGLP